MSLSPGKWHELVPTGLEENVRFRLRLLAAAERSEALRDDLLAVCREDIIFWINAFVMTFNPRRKAGDQVKPFVCWDYQKEALLKRPGGLVWCYERDKDCVVEKSRDMGATWLFLLLEDWLSIFHDYGQWLNVSRSEAAVDDASPDSLFWKLRFVHRHLPGWMLGEVKDQSMHLEFRRTRSVIGGEASTGRAGVGGRASGIFVDEFSQIKEAKQVRERTANTSDCRFFNGTHLGVGTEFYNLTQTPEITKVVMHWSRHPEKNRGLYRFDPDRPTVPDILDKSYEFPPGYQFVLDGTPVGGPFPGVRSPWYDTKAKAVGNVRAVAMELDINPQGAASQVFDPLLVRDLRLTTARPPVWVGDAEVADGRVTRMVRRDGGKLNLWCMTGADGRPAGVGRCGAGADVATGRGATPSCLFMVDSKTGETVLEYTDAWIKEAPFGELAVALCRWFGDPLLCWETPGAGLSFGDKVVELGYGHIYYKQDEFNTVKKPSTVPGWNNNPNGLLFLLNDLQAAMKERRLIVRSDLALEETLVYEYDAAGFPTNGKAKRGSGVDPSGAGANHADRVLALALANFMVKKMGQAPPEPEPEPEVPVNSLAWRRRLHEDRWAREEEWA